MWTQLTPSPLRAQLAEGERARIRGEAASSAGQSPRTEAGRGLPRLGRAEGELGLDAEALTHLDLCLKEYPPSEDRRVQEARVKFYDLRLQIRDRCKKMGCSYRDPAPSSGLGEEPRPVVKPMTQETKEPEKKEVPKEFAPPPEGKPKAPSAKWPVVISTAAVGAVGVGLGGGFHFVSQGAGDGAEALRADLVDDDFSCETHEPEECAAYAGKRQEYYDFRTGSAVGFIAGGALVAGAVVMAIVWPEARKDQSTKVKPAISAAPGHYFLGIQGKF